ncbi:hypothetical protein OZ410_11820 [Robiginitalea sp. M366]|uniref:hypothetical protein n=1 Tax=Robiginitalea aestuariiviva TaxID=3036903 RepID=UPI00240CE653|nr:hypothetical protein [Robiginitalea aestuariiviva]MDG1573007.1 hypothetical protein [Robiginitalea aestuariiviva]
MRVLALHRIAAILLLLLLHLPALQEALHGMREHSESHCKENFSTHYHSTEWHCDFDHYHFSPALEAAIPLTPQPVFRAIYAAPLAYYPVYTGGDFSTLQLRGPPC